jgi:DNA repair exonuclease SbcCD ATPase subunit
MKLTGAYGGANLNIKREDSLKKLSKLDTNARKLGGTKAEFTGVNKLEALSAQTLEQTKFYQTKISQLQNATDSLKVLEDVVLDKKEAELSEFKAEVERVLSNKNFSDNELLKELDSNGLGLDKDISEAQKQEVIREMLLKVEVKKKEFNSKIESYQDEIMKVKLASENIKAASSQFENSEELKETLNSIKSALENGGLEVQNKASQARVMNLLNS